jgi:hypothetical protein
MKNSSTKSSIFLRVVSFQCFRRSEHSWISKLTCPVAHVLPIGYARKQPFPRHQAPVYLFLTPVNKTLSGAGNSVVAL